MSGKAVSGMMLTLLLIGMLTPIFNIQPAKATGTIFIMADGSVNPPTAPIQRDGDIYTFTADIYDEIEVWRGNITIDGNGYTLQGSGIGEGFHLFSVNNVTLQDMNINNFHSGIYLYSSSLNTFSRNKITSNSYGIELHGFSDESSIYKNNITDNACSLWLCWASNNVIYHNNIVGGLVESENYPNVLDQGYPSGGNYWSDYDGVDVKKGSNQDQPGSDGIGDKPYIIDENNRDRYPLMNPFGSPPPPIYTLTITATANGTTNPAPGTYTYSKGQNVPVQAIPNAEYILDYWKLDGVNIGPPNPVNVRMNSNRNLRAMFTIQTYDVTIKANCYTEGVDVSVDITMDGAPTGCNTPHTFTGLTGTHTFTVPSIDANGHPFKQWSTGETNTTITVNSSGTYTAYYDMKYTLTITTTTGGNTNPAPGTYTHWSGAIVSVTAIPHIGYYLDYWKLDGVNIGPPNPVNVHMETNRTLHAAFAQLSPGHDVTIRGLSSKTVVGQGCSSTIRAITMNVGSYTETFNVTVYADQNTTIIGDEVTIGNQTVSSLTSGNSTTLTFIWNTTGVAKGNYTITAYAWPVPDETDTTDNTLTNGWIIVTMIGDITGGTADPMDFIPDGNVDMKDIATISRFFGLDVPPAPPNCDITGPTKGVPDGKIDMRDVATAARHFGETDP